MRRRLLIFTTLLVASGVFLSVYVLDVPTPKRAIFPFPADKRCAIAITDDTDCFQFASVDPVFALLDSLGLCVTKTVWAFDAERNAPDRVGLSLANPTYRRWVIEKLGRGHEITLHSATSGDDTRQTTLAAFDTIRALVGEYPRLEIFHLNNREALYWGRKRIPNRLLQALYGARQKRVFEGDDPRSPYYWLDLARDRVRYVRTYTFNDIDTWAVNPTMPYEDARTPRAPLWFASSNGRSRIEFLKLLSPENVNRLKEAGGVSVIYTHFSAGFVERTERRPRTLGEDVRETLLRCGRDPAIEFVPAGEVLDRLFLVRRIQEELGRGEETIRIPRALQRALEDLSVAPSLLAKSYPNVFPSGSADEAGFPGATRSTNVAGAVAVESDGGASAERIPLLDWLASSGIKIEPAEQSVFDETPRIGWRERWRLVGRWLLTQVVSPT